MERPPGFSRHYVLLLLAAAALAGCVSSTPPSTSDSDADASQSSGRYSIVQDRAPSRPLNPDEIQEVVPVPETRTLAGNYSPYVVNGSTYTVMDSEEGYEETGLASWYGEKFHGHRTSNGEIYDMYQISAAHRSLPIPSYVRVTNLDNRRSVLVRVNDRGPFHSERVIDLSYAAAWKLGFADQGTARVHLEAVVTGGPAPKEQENRATLADAASHFLQVGAFSQRSSAERVRQRVQDMTGTPAFIRPVVSGTTRLYRVRLGPIPGDRELDRISSTLQDTDLGRPHLVEESR
ncbi:MAG: septal ring lytic transglycosylase RlpA family protein [Pseudohongiellaceae bacterium]